MKIRRPLNNRQNLGQHVHQEEVRDGLGHPTRRVGDYNLYQPVGKGSFGEVRLARCDNDPARKLYACKVIKLMDDCNQDRGSGQRSNENQSRPAVAREIDVMRHIPEHPNIVRFHKALKTQTKMYIMLEYCDMGDLSSFIRERHIRSSLSARNRETHFLDEVEASYITRDVVRGLSHL